MEQLQSLFSFLPEWAVGPLIAAITIFVGWFIARIAAAVIAGVINKTGLGKKAKLSGNNIGKSLSSAVFWVVWLIFILMGLSQFPLVADQLGFLDTMMNDIFGYLPKLITGAVVIGIGAVLSNVIKNVVSSTLEVAQVDNLASRYNLTGTSDIDSAPAMSIASSVGKIIGAVVLITFGITAIGIWDIPGISGPVSEMLDLILSYIPRVIGGAIILGIAVFIAKFVSNLAQSTLPALGLDNSFSAIDSLDGDSMSGFKPSKLVGTIAFIAITLMGLTAAMTTLDIPALSDVFGTLLAIGSKIILGAVIIGGGVFIANFVVKLITPTMGTGLANAIRYILITLISFMGLSEMGLGDNIVETAFSYGLGAAAVAAGIGGALAFGFGGRDWAKAKLNEFSPIKRTARATAKKK
ncbi:MAG: mechanosensitive ion channel [Robiginitomaculum sp.]